MRKILLIGFFVLSLAVFIVGIDVYRSGSFAHTAKCEDNFFYSGCWEGACTYNEHFDAENCKLRCYRTGLPFREIVCKQVTSADPGDDEKDPNYTADYTGKDASGKAF